MLHILNYVYIILYHVLVISYNPMQSYMQCICVIVINFGEYIPAEIWHMETRRLRPFSSVFVSVFFHQKFHLSYQSVYSCSI